MFVVVMTLAVHVLVGMFTTLMGMLMAVMSMSHGLVLMFVLVFVLVVAAHFVSPPFQSYSLYFNSSWLNVKLPEKTVVYHFQFAGEAILKIFIQTGKMTFKSGVLEKLADLMYIKKRITNEINHNLIDRFNKLNYLFSYQWVILEGIQMNTQEPKIIHLRCYGYPTRYGTWIASCIDLSLMVERPSMEESIQALQDQIVLYVESVFDTEDKESIPYLLNRPSPWYQKLHYYFIGSICRFQKICRGFKFNKDYPLPQAA